MIHVVASILLAGCLAQASVEPIPEAFPSDLVTFDPLGVDAVTVGPLLRVYLRYEGGSRSIQVVRHQRATEVHPWSTTDFRYETEFHVTSVSAREGGDELYIAGFDVESGQDVLVRWTFERPDGDYALTADLPVESPVLGVPLPPLSLTLRVRGDLEPGEQAPGHGSRVRPTRQEIHRGDLGRIRDLEVDPEGRFVLVLSHVDHELLRLDLVGDQAGAVRVLYDETQLPNLATARWLAVFGHESLGRTYVLTDSSANVLPEHRSAFLHDSDNDGEIDDVVVLGTADTYGTAYDLAADGWIDYAELAATFR